MLVVVAAAIVDGSPPRLLVAQRSAPPELAGRWELPGGKVEPAEDERAALRRECREELDVDVLLGDRVGTDVVIGDGYARLRVWAARLADGRPPRPLEHRALRWVGAAEVRDVDWLPSNTPLLGALERLLAQSSV